MNFGNLKFDLTKLNLTRKKMIAISVIGGLLFMSTGIYFIQADEVKLPTVVQLTDSSGQAVKASVPVELLAYGTVRVCTQAKVGPLKISWRCHNAQKAFTKFAKTDANGKIIITDTIAKQATTNDLYEVIKSVAYDSGKDLNSDDIQYIVDNLKNIKEESPTFLEEAAGVVAQAYTIKFVSDIVTEYLRPVLEKKQASPGAAATNDKTAADGTGSTVTPPGMKATAPTTTDDETVTDRPNGDTTPPDGADVNSGSTVNPTGTKTDTPPADGEADLNRPNGDTTPPDGADVNSGSTVNPTGTKTDTPPIDPKVAEAAEKAAAIARAAQLSKETFDSALKAMGADAETIIALAGLSVKYTAADLTDPTKRAKLAGELQKQVSASALLYKATRGQTVVSALQLCAKPVEGAVNFSKNKCAEKFRARTGITVDQAIAELGSPKSKVTDFDRFAKALLSEEVLGTLPNNTKELDGIRRGEITNIFKTGFKVDSSSLADLTKRVNSVSVNSSATANEAAIILLENLRKAKASGTSYLKVNGIADIDSNRLNPLVDSANAASTMGTVRSFVLGQFGGVLQSGSFKAFIPDPTAMAISLVYQAIAPQISRNEHGLNITNVVVSSLSERFDSGKINVSFLKEDYKKDRNLTVAFRDEQVYEDAATSYLAKILEVQKPASVEAGEYAKIIDTFREYLLNGQLRGFNDSTTTKALNDSVTGFQDLSVKCPDGYSCAVEN
jgi:hypothetical protein